jgi:secreted trypsin-like serine protease
MRNYRWWLLGVPACVIIVFGVVQFGATKNTPVKLKLKGSLPVARPQIVGGTVAVEHEFPWQVWLHPTNYVDVYCGASLINSSWVLTAAHCVSGETAATLVVELGVHDIKGTNPYRQTISLSQIIVHPQYNSNTEDYDMALLHLSKPATLNLAVAPVTLAASTDTALYAAGVNAIVSGWGTTEFKRCSIVCAS